MSYSIGREEGWRGKRDGEGIGRDTSDNEGMREGVGCGVGWNWGGGGGGGMGRWEGE